MRTESKVDSIVLDWLREGLNEKLDQLLHALEDLSGGTGGVEHIFESLQAVKTMDAVLSNADFQVLRVLLKEEMSALALLESKPPQTADLLSSVTETAWLLRSIFDRLRIGATVNAMSLLPMINRLRVAQSLPEIDTENVLARASIIWAESRVIEAPYSDAADPAAPPPNPVTLKDLLSQMEPQILQLMRGRVTVVPDLLHTFDLIIDHEVNHAVIVATRVFEELLNAIQGDPDRYLPLAQRVIGRLLRLFRMELQGREAVHIRHEAIEFATDLLLELLKTLPETKELCGETIPQWRAMLSTDQERPRFLGLETETLKQVAEALSEELNAAQDVLDIFVRGAKTDLEPLVRIQPRLEQIIGVLDTLNYTQEAELIQAALDQLIQVVRGGVVLDDAFLMKLAIAVMTTEQVVSQIGQYIVDTDDRPSMIDRVVNQSRLALATACYEDILAAKDIVNKSLIPQNVPPAADSLAYAVSLIRGVRNVLTIAELNGAMPLIEGLHDWLSLHGTTLSHLTPQNTDALAEVSAAIEFYLENLRDYQKELIQFLDGAMAMLPVLQASDAAGDVSSATVPTVDSGVPATFDIESDEHAAAPTPEPVELSSALPIDESLASIDDLIAQLSEDHHSDLVDVSESIDGELTETKDIELNGVPAVESSETVDLNQLLSSFDSSESQAPTSETLEVPGASVPPVDLALPLQSDSEESAAETLAFNRSDESADAWLSLDLPPEENGMLSETDEVIADAATPLAWDALNLPPSDDGPDLPSDIPSDGTLTESESPLLAEPDALPVLSQDTESAEFPVAESPDLPFDLGDPLVDVAATQSAEISASVPIMATPPASAPLDPMAHEMRMVFAEEMADEVPTLLAATERWINSGLFEDLTIIRRSFHTIKGSSRMVALTAIGDWGWAYEDLLTRVLDRRISVSSDLRADVLSAVQLMAAARPVLDQGTEPPETYWHDSRVAAEHWMVGDADTEEDVSTVGGQDEPADFLRPDTAASDVTMDMADTEASTSVSAVRSAEAHSMDGPQPIIDDPVLREIFDTESSGYIQQLMIQVDHALENRLSIVCDKELVRLVHTLLGSARTAGVQPIAQIADRLEEWVQLFEEHHQSLEFAALDIFRDALVVMDGLRQWAIDPSLDQPDLQPVESQVVAQIEMALALMVPGGESVERDSLDELRPPESALDDEPTGLSTEGFQSHLADDHESFLGHQPISEFLLAPRPDDQTAEQDPDILQIFLEEAEELLEKADGYIAHWRSHPHDLDSIRLVHRNLHTLKGGARMAGLLNLADVTHLLEDRLDRARDRGGEEAGHLIALVQYTYDALGKMLDLVRRQAPVPAQTDLLAMIVDEKRLGKTSLPVESDDVLHSAQALGGESLLAESAHADSSSMALPSETMNSSNAVVASVPATTGTDAPPPARVTTTSTANEVRREQIRVDAERIDDLVNQVGESVLLQSRVDRQVSGFERQLFELQQTLTRLRGQLRRLEIETESQMKAELMAESGLSVEEFDPLEFDRFTHVQELSRGIMESLGDISSIEEAMSDLTEHSQLLLLQQSRLGRKLQDGMLALRMVRFNDVVGRLRRIVRQVGDEVGRSAELIVHNGETELDRVTLVGLLPSLEHMIRNSLAHGIEQPEERRAKGKAEVGKIEITIESSGGNVTLELKDDGRGLDLDAIRRKAIDRKLIAEDIELTDDEARSLIFLPGFSTAGNVSQIAGRGVGMDVVAGSVREMGGFVDLQSEYGVYTRIQLNLPLTQAMTRGILVSVGDDRFAIPYKGVVSVTRMTAVQLAEQYASDKPAVTLNGERYPLFNLGELLTHEPFNSEAQETGIRPVFLFKLGERRFALQVDHQLGGIQLFVKSLGPQLGRIPGLSGATIADDGNVILVLELFELVRQYQRRDDREVDLTASVAERRRPVVLVVDDSLTVRKVTARTLERNNLDVILARDGVEALGVLHEQRPDLVLTDIEMPRMDGFELLGAIRNDPQTRSVPVIMISSRTGHKHRNRAEHLGVSAYLGKPYAEADLIGHIEKFLAGKREHIAVVQGMVDPIASGTGDKT